VYDEFGGHDKRLVGKHELDHVTIGKYPLSSIKGELGCLAVGPLIIGGHVAWHLARNFVDLSGNGCFCILRIVPLPFPSWGPISVEQGTQI
jgi:hypothetical protein